MRRGFPRLLPLCAALAPCGAGGGTVPQPAPPGCGVAQAVLFQQGSLLSVPLRRDGNEAQVGPRTARLGHRTQRRTTTAVPHVGAEGVGNQTGSNVVPLVIHEREATGATDHSHAEASDHDHDHGSLFTIDIVDIDNMYFHTIFGSMLVFTIIVDRLEWLADAAVKGNRANEMFLSRVNAEIMMFGFVGVGVFVTSQFIRVPHDKFIFFEFVDIFCSLSAVMLIGIAAVLFLMKWRLQKKFVNLMGGAEWEQELLAEARQAVSLRDVRTNEVELYIMRMRFQARNRTDPRFDFSLYLRESLTNNVCDLMNISWVTWFLILLLNLAFIAYRLVAGRLFTEPQPYLIAFVVCCWVTWGLHLAMEHAVNRGGRTLVEHLGTTEVESLRRSLHQAVRLQCAHTEDEMKPGEVKLQEGHVGSKKLLNHRTFAIVREALQLVSVFSAFEWAWYLMDILHNARKLHLAWWWHAIFIAPLCLNLFVHLPSIISKYSLVQCYFDPDPEVMDVVISQCAQLEEDLRFLRTQLERRPDWQAMLPIEFRGAGELMRFLRKLDMHLSKVRVCRLFHAIDKDNSGVLDSDEIVAALQKPE